MKEIYCIAIDDEPWALQVIEQFCQRKGGIKLITFSEPLVGLSEIKRSEPDLVFLDIEMNSLLTPLISCINHSHTNASKKRSIKPCDV